MITVFGRTGKTVLLYVLISGALIAAGVAVRAYLSAPPEVVTIAVGRGEVVGRVVATGLVEPSIKEEITSRVGGNLEQFDLKEGDTVKQGQVIARIVSGPYLAVVTEAQSKVSAQESQLAQLERRTRLTDEQALSRLKSAEQKLLLARSQLTDREIAASRAVSEASSGVTRVTLQLQRQPFSEQIQADMVRAEELLRFARADLERLAAPDHPARIQVALAETDVRDARQNLEAAAVLPQEATALRAALAAALQAQQKAREDLEATTVVAPFSGVVLQTSAKKNASVAAGAPLITLARVDVAKVVAAIDETDIDRVRAGMAARISSPSIADLRLEGKVSRIMPRAGKDASNATVVKTEVEFQNEGGRMRDGMSADVEIEVSRKADAVRLPVSALRGKGSDRFVFVLENGAARRRPVVPGLRDAVWVEVVSGLKPGEVVIAAPEKVVKALTDGQPVVGKGN